VTTRDPEETRRRLLLAARKEFNGVGFLGTDTNRIARAAGYAPQTFYRHFEDKTAIFVAVYDEWWKAEAAALGRLDEGAKDRAVAAARIAIAFHTRWRVFRRSLRLLMVEDKRVRASRLAARKVQIARAKKVSKIARSDAEWAAILFTSERLCDAAAEGELTDLGLDKKAVLAVVAKAVAPLVGED
jgi:AcrR family transcriptional regulator